MNEKIMTVWYTQQSHYKASFISWL
jgi:hypothetical protein